MHKPITYDLAMRELETTEPKIILRIYKRPGESRAAFMARAIKEITGKPGKWP